MGECPEFQKRRENIYETLKVLTDNLKDSHMRVNVSIIIQLQKGNDDLQHGFIQFLQMNPTMVHGFTELYSLYLNRVYRTKSGVMLELEDFLEKKTYYLNLYEQGKYKYDFNDDDDIFLEFNQNNFKEFWF